MLKRVLILIALAFAAPLAAQSAEPPQDPACPHGDLNVPRTPGDVCIGTSGDRYAFSLVYPRRIAEIPALDVLLREEAARRELELRIAYWAARTPEATADGAEVPPMSYEAGWQLDAITPELVAISANIQTYTGGAHEAIGYDVMLLDRHGNDRLRLVDLFQPRFFEHGLLGHQIMGVNAVQMSFCRALTAEIRERRSDPGAEIECPRIEEQPVTLVCGASGRIDAMRALLAPSVVGVFAEGPFEVDFPMNARIITGMKRQYRVAFAIGDESRPRPARHQCQPRG